MFRLPQYVQRLKLGSTNPASQDQGHAQRAGNRTGRRRQRHGHYYVVAKTAELAIELARENGVAWVGCRMSGHTGAAGVTPALPLKHDMIGIYSAVANANHMPLAGGASLFFGTNPLAIAIPAGEEPPLSTRIRASSVITTAPSRTTNCSTAR